MKVRSALEKKRPDPFYPFADPKLTQLENTLELIKGEKVLSQRLLITSKEVIDLSKITLNKQTTSGLTELVANAEKTTTVIGSYDKDLHAIFNQIRLNPQTRPLNEVIAGFERGNQGGFNFLHVSDDVYRAGGGEATFFKNVNAKWIDAAIARGDDIVVVSSRTWMRKPNGKLTGFGEEVERFIEKGYHWNSDFTRLLRPSP